jgi:hypothetical protein
MMVMHFSAAITRSAFRVAALGKPERDEPQHLGHCRRFAVGRDASRPRLDCGHGYSNCRGFVLCFDRRLMAIGYEGWAE